MAVFDELMVIQGLDTDLVRINHRLGHLPEADEVRRVEAELANVTVRLAQVETELKNAGNAVAANETGVGDIRRQTERLSAQLRTVIAPREAEALQHEIEVLRVRASDLDEASLVEMSRIDDLEVDRERLGTELAALNERAGAARAARDAGAADLTRERDDVTRRRAEASDRKSTRLNSSHSSVSRMPSSA